MIDSQTRVQLFKFAASGIIATVVDFGTYFGLLYTVLPGGHEASKGVAYVLGTTVAYLLAKYWTFPDRDPVPGETRRFLVLYGVAFAVNVGVNSLLLALLGVAFAALGQPALETVAVVGATGCSMTLNFIGQKFWVFADAPA